jgi:NAD(P)-dependent dehydrogenase (short-subunit alcohol dehydrogenase family)
MNPIRLQGAVVAITGAGGSIGRETAIAMAGAGALVAAGDLDGDSARATAELLGDHARGYAVDVRSRESMEEFLAQLTADFGAPPRVFVNNAGVMPLGPFVPQELDVIERAIDVNLWGVIHGTQLAARAMIEAGEGHIINVASLMGRSVAPGAAAYGAAKHAAVGLGATVAMELAGTGVTLTTVLPSAVNTPLIDGIDLPGILPVVEPYEVAAAILASCQHRRTEVTVPGWMSKVPDIERLLPSKLITALRKRFGGDAALDSVDASARADYENRVRTSELVG